MLGRGWNNIRCHNRSRVVEKRGRACQAENSPNFDNQRLPSGV